MTTLEQHSNTPPAAAGPLDRLRALHADGALAREYASLPALLAQIPADRDGFAELRRIGLLLERLDPEEVAEHGAAAGAPVETFTVAVVGHSTLTSLYAALTAEFARHGTLLRTVKGGFDSYLRDLQDTASPLYSPGVKLALCLLDPEVVFDEVAQAWTAEDVEAAARAKLAQLDRLVQRYTERGGAHLVLNTVPLQRAHTHRFVDYRSRAALGIAWREFNAGLLRLAARYPGVSVIDLDPLLADAGPVNDPRLSLYAKAHLGDELLSRYAREVGHLAQALRGRTKKALVVDLDNTLWDGVLGDDGPDGVAAAGTLRGEAFGRFQQVVKHLGSQGVVLAVSSKNDQDAVLRALQENPDMVLREPDFARINANWAPKDANLRDLAAGLNLGLDSFVFADDSPFETGLVAASLPQVAVVQLDDEPAWHVGRLLADGWFDTLAITDEDRARGGLYRAEAARQVLLENTDSPEEYLRELGITVTVARVLERDVPRVSQLTLRTNQFNLTTLRLQPEEVRARAEDPQQLVLAVRSADRFGDNGTVGAIFARRSGDTLHIDNVLLSCRVFSRGIEQAALSALLRHAAATGLAKAEGVYRPSPKNANFRGFYAAQGFEPVAEPGGEAARLVFRRGLAAPPAVPEHIRLDSELEGPNR